MNATSRNRKPGAFRPDKTDIRETGMEFELPPEPRADLPARIPGVPVTRRGFRWGAILFGAITGILSLAAALWLQGLVSALLVREDWLGWLAIGLISLAGFAALMIALREAYRLARLKRLGTLRLEAERAIIEKDKALAKSTVHGLKRLYAGREDMAWGRRALAEHEGDIMDAGEALRLAERALIAPLDPAARAIVAASAKRITIVTAVSPAALVDMAFVAAENLRMLRQIAALYGARPGGLSMIRLARMVVTHIVLTGGIAIGDDLIHQMIGHGVTARLSARLGEGIFNGALTTRIGLAAIDVCRPLPYIEAQRPRFRDMVAEVAGLRFGE